MVALHGLLRGRERGEAQPRAPRRRGLPAVRARGVLLEEAVDRQAAVAAIVTWAVCVGKLQLVVKGDHFSNPLPAYSFFCQFCTIISNLLEIIYKCLEIY